MNDLEDDPIIGKLFDSPEKKVKWLIRFRIAYIVWIIFLIIGILSLLIWYLIK